MGGAAQVRARVSGRVCRAQGSRTSFWGPVIFRLGPSALVEVAKQATASDTPGREGWWGGCPCDVLRNGERVPVARDLLQPPQLAFRNVGIPARSSLEQVGTNSGQSPCGGGCVSFS